MADVVRITISAVDQTERAFRTAGSGLQALTKIASGLSITLGTLAAGAMAAAARAAAALTLEAIRSADQMGQLAQQSGIAVAEFSALAHAANLAGTNTSTLKTAMKGLSDEMAQTGRTNAGLLETVLSTADQFASMPDGIAKVNAAVRLFGKSGQDLIPLLNQGSAAIRGQMQEAEQLGLVIGKNFARNADAFGDNLERLRRAAQGLWLRVAENLLPALVELSDWTVRFVKESGAVVTSANAISGAFLTLKDAADAVSESVGVEKDALFKGLEMSAKAMMPSLIIGHELLKKFIERGEQAKILADAAKPIPGLATDKGEGFDAKRLDKARKMADELAQISLRGLAAVVAAENAAHKKRLEQIDELGDIGKEGDGLRELAESVHQQRLDEIHRQGLGARAQMDELFRNANLEGLQKFLESESALELEALEQRQAVMREFAELVEATRSEEHNKLLSFLQAIQNVHATSEELANASLNRLGTAVLNFASSAAQAISSGLGNAIANIATGAQTASEAFKALGSQMLAMLVKFAVQLAVNALLAAVLSKFVIKTALAAATPLLALNTASATAAAIASYGAALEAAPFVIPAMVANAATAASLFGSFAGAAHGGLDRVPGDGTYLLSQGEAVLQPAANRDLREFLERQNSTVNMQVSIFMDGELIAKGVSQMTRDGRVVIHPRSVRET